MTENSTKQESVWKVKPTEYPDMEPVQTVYESYRGDLYFITEQDGTEIFCYARLYSMPQYAEWGYNDIEALKSQYGEATLWEVPERNWNQINSYEDGLLVEVTDG